MTAAADPPTTADSVLLRRTRLRLMLWSGGLTLLVLLILGGAVYLTVSRALAASGTAVLQDRAADVGRFVSGPGPGPRPGHSPIGVSFGGRGSGTLAIVVQPDGTVLGIGEDDALQGLPDEAGIAAAKEGRNDVRTADVEEIPVRILSQPVERDDGVYVVQIVGERLSEQRLLQALTIALLGGGLAALLLASGVGYVYAGRALVPIRDAMGRRDEALRRQREFTANASHELRTPLTLIRASVDDLRRNRTQRVADVGDALDDIEVEVGHGTARVDDLLLMARTDAGALELHLELIDLADIAAEAAGALTGTAAAREVGIVVDPRPAPMSGDALRIRQLVSILIDNAVRHSPPASQVVVTIRPEAASVSLHVDDAGRGIRPEERELVFERFWRADDSPQGGTGLGLAIAAWIVTQHGGVIEAVDAPSGGARFRARMPAHLAAPSAPAQETPAGG
jgi:signal transduction histidine kinase